MVRSFQFFCRCLSPILIVFLLLGGKPACIAQENYQFRILTYNIYHGATTRGDFNLDTIANRINFHQPDLVALQEVDRKTNRSHQMDLVAELGIRTQLSPLFARAMYFDSGEYGNGVLSKFSFIKTTNIALPASANHEPRAALEVLFETPGGDTLVFVATHLDHNQEASDRLNQATELVNRYRDSPYPVILAGDLNDTPESETLNLFRSAFSCSSGVSAAPTYPSGNPTKKIDYILLDKKHRWKLIRSEVIQDEMVSDHCGYFVVLELMTD